MAKKLYLVQRVAWRPFFRTDIRRPMCLQHDSPEGVPVRAFVGEAGASSYAKELIAEARRDLNPFLFCDEYLEVISEGDGGKEKLLAALAALGLPEPTHQLISWNREYIDWARWYDELADSLSVKERNAIWDLLDGLELYRVVEVEFFF